MAVPAYNSTGTGSNVVGGTNPTPAWPASPQVGAIALMSAAVRGDATRTMATPSGWALVDESAYFGPSSNNKHYVFVYGTVANPTPLTGSESGTVTVTVSGGTAGRNAAIIHQFTGQSSTWHLENIDSENEGAADTAYADNDVTTSGADRLALNIVDSGTNQAGALVIPTNMTGGTWALRNDYTANNPSLHLVTADMASSGTVGTGTSTVSVSTAFGICGLAIYADAPAGGAVSGVFGEPGIFGGGVVR